MRVGCAQLTYENTNKMLKALKQYFADPEAAEKAYYACNALRGGPRNLVETAAQASPRTLGAGIGAGIGPVSTRHISEERPPEGWEPDKEAVEDSGPDQERESIGLDS